MTISGLEQCESPVRLEISPKSWYIGVCEIGIDMWIWNRGIDYRYEYSSIHGNSSIREVKCTKLHPSLDSHLPVLWVSIISAHKLGQIKHSSASSPIYGARAPGLWDHPKAICVRWLVNGHCSWSLRPLNIPVITRGRQRTFPSFVTEWHYPVGVCGGSGVIKHRRFRSDGLCPGSPSRTHRETSQAPDSSLWPAAQERQGRVTQSHKGTRFTHKPPSLTGAQGNAITDAFRGTVPRSPADITYSLLQPHGSARTWNWKFEMK